MADLSYEASVAPEPLPGRPNPRFPDEASPNAFGAAVGKGLEDAGTVLHGVYTKVQDEARQSQVADAHNQLQVLQGHLTSDQTTGALTKQGKDAFGLNQQYLPQWDQQSQAIVDGVVDPRAREAARQAAQTMRAQFSEQLDSHELKQHKIFAAQTAQASVNLAQHAGPANYNHADILRDNLDTIDYSMQRMGEGQGWSQDQIDSAKQEQVSKFHGNVIDRILADKQGPMAQAYLDHNKDSMDANSAFHAQKAIDAANREKDNTLKADISDRYQDSVASASFGLPGSIGVSKAELEFLRPGHGARLYDGLQTMQRAGAQSRLYDQMTPEQITDDVNKAMPTQGGEGAKFDIQAYEIRRQAAERSIKARDADPAQFAIDSGAGWKSLDMRDVQGALAQLRTRANSQEQVSTQTGVNTPLLTKPDTKALTGWLDKQEPAARLQTLQQFRQAMPDDASYASLLKSIAPGSPLTAIAGSTLDRPPTTATPPWFDSKYSTDSVVGQRILEGEQILKAKDEKGIASKFPMPPDKTTSNGAGLDTAFAAAIGGASSDLFRGRSDTLESYYAAYKAMYAAEANHAGVSSGILNGDIAQRAAQAVIGPATTYGHTSLVVPSGMDPTRFQGVVDSASQSALRAGGYSDTDIAALRGYGLRELGDTLGTGRYVIINGAGDPLKSKSGRTTVVVDLNRSRSQHASVFQDPAAVPDPGISLSAGEAGK